MLHPMSATTPTTRLHRADPARDLDVARMLFREYAASLGFDLDFQGFEDELRALPGEYGEPRGVILLAEREHQIAGCVALRPLEDDGVCEMKRMYVRPAHRAAGVGRALALAILEEARTRGYRKMRLDTVASMTPAITLYTGLGFRTIEPYRFNPLPGALYFEADL
jgi:GNAT superfamily N-acetyltransferase